MTTDEMSYTKGPWRVVHNDKKDYPFILNDEKKVIAQVIGDGVKIEGNHANAQLISSAPDMYQALKLLQERDDYGSLRLPTQAKEIINQALAKAEGH